MKKAERKTINLTFSVTLKAVEYAEGEVKTNCGWCAWNCFQEPGEGTGETGNQWEN